jgi:hypothetical protein
MAWEEISSTITSLSTSGIQYRILVVFNAQRPLFIGWGAEWVTAVICTDSVRKVNLARPDGQLCDRIFWEFCWKSFLFKSRVRTVRHWPPDGRTSAVSNFHIRLSTSGPWGMNVRTTILQHAISISAMRASGPWEADFWTVEVKSTISISDERTSGPMLTDVRTVVYELRFLPYLWARLDGKPHCLDGCINLPLYWTWKESEADRSLIGVRTGCWESEQMQAGTEASRYSGGSGRKEHVVRMDDAWSVGRPDGMTHCPDGWTVDRGAYGRDDTSSGRLTGNLNFF